MKKNLIFAFVALLGFGKCVAKVNTPQTYVNPVYWADMPDPDVIRTGSDYWLVTTTMHLMPGAPIMHSKDLVNWEPVSYLYDRMDDGPRYSLDGMTAYSHGQWATSLRYHNGKFYALFAPNDRPSESQVYTTDDPRKGWTLYSRLPHFHDSSLFFDDDGRVYVFHGTGSLTELQPDLKAVRQGGVNQQVFERDKDENGLLEGSRVIKHNGKYYLIMISWPGNKPRRQVCYRADKITGPYEKRVILEDNYGGFSYAAQGTIVDTPEGDWYAFIFQDHGAIGRVPLLMPVRWVDGWPMMGDEQGKVPREIFGTLKGQPVKKAKGKGRVATPASPQSIVVSDDFSSRKLDLMHWQWNHNPIDSAWSLTERKGWLRLKTARVVDNLYMAPNTISQRMEGPKCSATVELDLSGLKDGDRAGLSAFNGHSGVLTVCRDGGNTQLVLTYQQVAFGRRDRIVDHVDVDEQGRVNLTGNKVWLRIDGDFRLRRDKATFYYSTDGRTWKQLGGEFQMRFDYRLLFMGTRYALFCYATQQTGGYADFNSFNYTKESALNDK